MNLKKGEYKAKIEASRPRGLSEDGIRKAKNQRAHTRTIERKQQKRKQAEERQEERNKRSDKEQIKIIKRCRGNSHREYAKLEEKVKNDK